MTVHVGQSFYLYFPSQNGLKSSVPQLYQPWICAQRLITAGWQLVSVECELCPTYLHKIDISHCTQTFLS